jgi:antitoxin component HigA of HigAB toxin-antitoxin module
VAATSSSVVIRSDHELDKTASRVCRLLSLGRPLTKGEEALLDALSDAIKAYESIHYPIPDPSDAALLAHLLDAREATPAQLAKATGIPLGDVRGILDGRRQIDPGRIGELAKFFKVDRSVFVSDCPDASVKMTLVGSPRGSRRAHVMAWVSIQVNSVKGRRMVSDLVASGFSSAMRQTGRGQPFESQFQAVYG